MPARAPAAARLADRSLLERAEAGELDRLGARAQVAGGIGQRDLQTGQL